jgi:hypothetical protein
MKIKDMKCPKLLHDAIGSLYAAFSKYPLPEETWPCPCCHSANANALLHAAPLQELQWDHLAGYSTEALMVWGDLDCYKHFLPRVFELVLIAGEWPKSPTPESVFGILRYGQWRTWPREEQEAVERMLHAVWETVRSNPPIEGGYIDVDQWLCCISQCEDDLAPYLDQWMKDERLSSSWALSSLILGSTIAYTDADTNHDPPVWEGEESRAKFEEWSRLPHREAFWKNCDIQYTQLQKWVQSPAALEKLRRAETTCEHSEMEREFRAAQQCILEARSTKFEVVYRERRFQTAYWESPTFRLC